MNVLIIGKGYIGKYIQFRIPISTIISKNEIDYSNPVIFRKYLQTMDYDYIVNCSGFTGIPNVDACELEKEKCYHYNVTVPLYLTKVANELNIPIAHIGSGCIYTGNTEFTENDIPNFGADSFDSSFYSKTKDAFEKLSAGLDRRIFRIRICFNGAVENKNYLYKLMTYDNLIDYPNSITNVDDLSEFVYKFIAMELNNPGIDYSGIYNVVNTGTIQASEIVPIMKEYNVGNPRWKFVTVEEANFKAGRSNCILSTDKIKSLGLELPNVKDKMHECIAKFSAPYPF